MFVFPPRLKTQGAVAMVGALALGACSDSTARTDLRPEGPPDVLAVLVLSDAVGGLYETATYCRPNDEKRPTLVGLPDFTTTNVCDDDPSVPADIAEAAPGGWYVRIMFDELLDPTIEKLIPILDELGQPTGTFIGSLEDSQPVTLECQGVDDAFHPVPYDGYYSPSGNAVTWPVGPSLVIKPLDPTIVPVASDCRVTIKADLIKDKEGIAVPSDQLGPFVFKTQPVSIVGTFPSDGGTVNTDQMWLFDYELDFNTVIDPATFTVPDDVTVEPNLGMIAETYTDGPFGFIFAAWTPGTDFTVTIKPDAKVSDACGKETTVRNELGSETATFSTRPFTLLSVTPAQGTGIAPSRLIRIDFNTPIDCASTATCSLQPSEYTVTPAIQNMVLTSETGDRGTIFVLGDYQLNTEYTFTINAGATVRDYYDTTDLAIEAAQTIKFTTAGALALTASTVTCTAAGFCAFAGGVLTKFDAAANGRVQLTFNSNMKGSTLTADEFTFTTADGTPVAGVTVGATTGTAVRVDAAALAAGNYKFTLKAGATIEDNLGNVYTQAADRVINFSVEVDDSVPPPHLCLGQTP